MRVLKGDKIWKKKTFSVELTIGDIEKLKMAVGAYFEKGMQTFLVDGYYQVFKKLEKLFKETRIYLKEQNDDDD